MKSIRTIIHFVKKMDRGPLGLPFRKNFIIHPSIFFLNQNDVEFYLIIGHALLLFPFF